MNTSQSDALRTYLIRFVAWAFLAAASFIVSSCREGIPSQVQPIAHNSSYDVWPDSIDLHEGIILRAMSDSVLQIRVEGNVIDTIKAPEVREGRMSFRSSFPILDFLYRLEASRPSYSGYTIQTPYEIYLNPLQTEGAEEILLSRLRNGVVLPAQTSLIGWPVTNANAEWLLAAVELATATGDKKFTSTVASAARTAVGNDSRLCRNSSTGLFSGIPPYMAIDPGIFPAWMGSTEMGDQTTLGVNIAYCAALSKLRALRNDIYLEVSPDSLLHAIKHDMWIPNIGSFSALRYGPTIWQVPLQVTDNLAQAVGICAELFPDAMSRRIISNTPMHPSGAELFYPTLPDARSHSMPRVNRMLLQTAWTVAAACTCNDAAYSAATGALIAGEGARLLGDRSRLSSFRSSFTAFILKGLLGMRFRSDGVFFVPCVPEILPGEKHITGLQYRNSVLDITINGTGSVISTFTIDGKPSDTFFPANLEGGHSIAITLAAQPAEAGSINLQTDTALATLPPEVVWSDDRTARLEPNPAQISDKDDDHAFLVYLNGVLTDEIHSSEYNMYESRWPVAVEITSVIDNRLSGYGSQPHIYVPQSQRCLIYASQLAKTGTRILQDKKLASKFVESNKFKNRTISFDYDAPEEGTYLISAHYANGLGVVNSQRRVALRQLRANGKIAGVLLFQQLKPREMAGSTGESWQEQTAWSNTLCPTLHKGLNHLELRYLQISPVLADPTANEVLIDMVQIIPAGPPQEKR